ncbi:MAG TPA: Ku protein, partial [Arachnia sp.]|nr:Ku protein [Arachnia sp.]
MPRSIWKGAVSFGLVSIPVKVYGATEDRDVSFRQVHSTDGGRVRQQRVCEKCGEVVAFADIAKGYEAADGRVAVLTDEDFANLPLSTLKTVEVVQFVDEAEVDPTFFQRTYFLEAEAAGQKPYVLLREALAKEDKVAVVKVALRSRESLALIRPKDDVLLLHTMYWPDELRDGGFASPSAEVTISDAEMEMAKLLIGQLEG